jgi:hypothetical protein
MRIAYPSVFAAEICGMPCGKLRLRFLNEGRNCQLKGL